MNPIKTHKKMEEVHGVSCGGISCSEAGHCRYNKRDGTMFDTLPTLGACQYEWQCTLNYPGRYDNE